MNRNRRRIPVDSQGRVIYPRVKVGDIVCSMNESMNTGTGASTAPRYRVASIGKCTDGHNMRTWAVKLANVATSATMETTDLDCYKP